MDLQESELAFWPHEQASRCARPARRASKHRLGTSLLLVEARPAEVANETVAFANSRELKVLGKANPAFVKRVPQITDAAEADLAESKALTSFEQNILKPVAQNLAALAKRLFSE
jgi:hypothetical protein